MTISYCAKNDLDLYAVAQWSSLDLHDEHYLLHTAAVAGHSLKLSSHIAAAAAAAAAASCSLHPSHVPFSSHQTL